MGLKSGTMVELVQRREDVPIHARRIPESVTGPRGKRNEDGTFEGYSRVVICDIPAGVKVLYMCSKDDAFSTALRAKGRGPYGYTPATVTYHCVLWGERPVWVSSAEVELKPC